MVIKTPNYQLTKPEQTDFYDVDDFNQNADIIDTELKKQSDKVNNSLQKGVNNNITIWPMGQNSFTKTLKVNPSDWKGTTNLQQLDINIPVGGSFSGIIKVTYTSYWGGTDSHGGAVVTYQIGSYTDSGEKLNTYTIDSISPNFAKDFLIYGTYINSSSGIFALMVKKAPAASNPMEIKVEFQGYFNGPKTLYQIATDVNTAIFDSGSPTGGGIYPWVKQTPSFASSALPAWTNAVLGTGWEPVAGYPPLRFYKDGFGNVHLKGRVKTVTQSTPVVTVLPVGYRIGQTEEFIGMSGNSGIVNYDIQQNGAVAALFTTIGQNILIDATFRTD